MSSVGIIVEGSLDHVDDDSSDEEEIEVFDNENNENTSSMKKGGQDVQGAVHSSSTDIVDTASKDESIKEASEPQLSLITAMANAVKAIENEHSAANKTAPLVLKVSMPATLHDDGKDSFGIMYQPKKLLQAVQVNGDMSLPSLQAKAETDDDEFDVDSDAVDESDAVAEALARARLRVDQNSNEVSTPPPDADVITSKPVITTPSIETHSQKIIPTIHATMTSLSLMNEVIAEVDEEQVLIDEREEESEEARAAHEISRAELEWANLVSEELNPDGVDLYVGLDAVEAEGSSMTRVSYEEAIQYMRTLDFSPFESVIRVTETEGVPFMARLTNAKLNYAGCEKDLRLPFLIAQLNYNPHDTMHFSILCTIYTLLTGITTRISTTGPHWDDIGFQGLDPCTDVNRSMKMLAILQTLFFVENHSAVALRLLSYSNGTAGMRETWPFFCVAIMFTKQCIIAMRTGGLNKFCNKEKAILPIMHDFFCACFLAFEKLLFEDPSKHHAVHLDSIRKVTESAPTSFLTKFYLVHSHTAPAGVQKQLQTITHTAERQDVVFDDLEEVESKEIKKQRENAEQISSNSFLSIFGTKESRFRVSK